MNYLTCIRRAAAQCDAAYRLVQVDKTKLDVLQLIEAAQNNLRIAKQDLEKSKT